LWEGKLCDKTVKPVQCSTLKPLFPLSPPNKTVLYTLRSFGEWIAFCQNWLCFMELFIECTILL